MNILRKKWFWIILVIIAFIIFVPVICETYDVLTMSGGKAKTCTSILGWFMNLIAN
ncbi:MAG: hypothetical protein KC516_00920 [Nanoarchaeota archaeon]|nr:hypothetical protein [Nanoarchaeota archaeon]